MTNATAVSTKLDVTRAVQRLYNDWHDEAGFKFSWELATCDFVKKNPLASCRRLFCCLCMLVMHVKAACFCLCQCCMQTRSISEKESDCNLRFLEMMSLSTLYHRTGYSKSPLDYCLWEGGDSPCQLLNLPGHQGIPTCISDLVPGPSVSRSRWIHAYQPIGLASM
jgi:hypothetical protein